MTKQSELFGPTPSPARQAVLDLAPRAPLMSRAAYVLGASNEAALATLEAWATTTEPILVICGPAGSGKTHLARILAEGRAAPTIEILDEADRGPEPKFMLAAIERAVSGGGRAAIVGRGDPGDWSRGLRDLETRLKAAPRITLTEPDEALLRAVIAKLFRDRQLRAAQEIADYAAPRLLKTFAAALEFVAAMDAGSIEKGRPIGLKLAREVVANLSEAASGA